MMVISRVVYCDICIFYLQIASEGYPRAPGSYTMQKTTLISYSFIGLLVIVQMAASKALFEYACDPRSSDVTCLLGCLGCYEAYGGHMYNMAACCQECKDTQLPLIDDGPAKCSHRFIKGSWMRRFGK
ncbi:hypothetical protein MAR_000429 [Mya arenaria]|uniref:Uncharacterized protein n=1 Tax=Mya arenaria TaxID=6604 RepID=A0ABY7FCT9_MYAAR|nr:hypothetical protein MAR_000429 [Mya arenaria]